MLRKVLLSPAPHTSLFPCGGVVLDDFQGCQLWTCCKTRNNDPSWADFLWVVLLADTVCCVLVLWLELEWWRRGILGAIYSNCFLWGVFPIGLGEMWLCPVKNWDWEWDFHATLLLRATWSDEIVHKELSQSLCRRNWISEGFHPAGCSPILARQLQGQRKLPYLIVPAFLELLVYGLIGCHHDEARDHEIENGQGKKECDIVSGESEEGKKRWLISLLCISVNFLHLLINLFFKNCPNHFC